MMADNSQAAPLSRVIAAVVPPIATAGNDQTTVIGVVAEDATVSSVTYVPVTAITGAATNNRTVAVVDKGTDGSGSTSVASINYANSVNAAASDENTVTLSGTPANLNVSAGDVLVWTSTHIGTGIADPGGLVRVNLSRR
jgi:phage terminase large subunit-like protein